jgi:hypothetical protein
MCLGVLDAEILPLPVLSPETGKYSLIQNQNSNMKKLFQLFALMTSLLMGTVKMEAGAVLTFDFMTDHPRTTIRIDQGYKDVRGNRVYWKGEWAGLFGNKIAFDALSAYPSLRGDGGLVDYHDHQKMYIENLSAGDKVTFYYTGTNALLQYHVSSSCTMQTLYNNFDSIASGVAYRVISPGELCVLNKWKRNEAETIITKIVIETASNEETVRLTEGMCTYCSNNPLNFSAATGVRAYVATGYENGNFIFKQVKYVPSMTGFLVVSSDRKISTVSLPIGRSKNYKENVIGINLFQGALSAVQIVPVAGKGYYIFAVADGKVGIFKMDGSFQCQNRKAYLVVNK